MSKIGKLVSAFARDEEGIALTEYLVLLGLLLGGVIGAVLIAGGSLQTAWSSWSDFFLNTSCSGSGC